MQDLNPLERWLFDLFSRRSDRFLNYVPAVFLLVAVPVGVTAASLIAHRNPLTDPYVGLLIGTLLAISGLLSLLVILCLAAITVRSRTFRLLELYQTMVDIRSMSWQDFEGLVAASYRARGYDVKETGRDSADGGVDLVVRRKDKGTWLIQCKHYRDQRVGERKLRELLGVVARRGVTGGVFVTSGVFEEKASAFSKDEPRLELIAGEQLRDLIRDLAKKDTPAATPADTPAVTCPLCGSPMRERTSQYGRFLGCSNYPSCKGKRQLPLAG